MSSTNNSRAVEQSPRLTFSQNEMSLSMQFVDEISAYRARRKWIELLKVQLLVDHEEDFQISIKKESDSIWNMHCEFTSSCGRYAFWRIMNKKDSKITNELLQQKEGFLSRMLWSLVELWTAPDAKVRKNHSSMECNNDTGKEGTLIILPLQS